MRLCIALVVMVALGILALGRVFDMAAHVGQAQTDRVTAIVEGGR